jgi:hypothetical protein
MVRNLELDSALETTEALENDPETALLERLDSDPEFGAPDEPLPVSSPLSRRQVDELVERVLDEELQRLEEQMRKG